MRYWAHPTSSHWPTFGSSYALVREMRLVPFGLDDVVPLAGIAVSPILPLLLTVMPLDEMLSRVLKTIF